jgi:hypothetical protein
MNRFLLAAAVAGCIAFKAFAQQPPPQPPSPEQQRVEARKEVIVNWTLGDQAWSFREVMATYDPVRGYLEPHPNQGFVAIWKLRLARDLEEGAAKLHEETLGSPLRIVLLDADRSVIDNDAPAQITTPVGAKTDDTIELRVGLDGDALKRCKLIRVHRRTDVGF